ncbi:hypothetical protein MBLNU230_g2262t1 [Neophaeotheca triangularis]
MAEESRSLRSIHTEAEQNRNTLSTFPSSNSDVFQETLTKAINLYTQCLELADRLSLFSPNESLEDISTSDLQFLVLDYHLAELILRITTTRNATASRKNNLRRASQNYESYLKRLDTYDILSRSDRGLLESYQESPATFTTTTASSADAAARRDKKIARFKEEKALKQKLAHLRANPSVLANDETVARDLQLTEIGYATHQTFASLESIAQELQILALAPPSPPPEFNPELIQGGDSRERSRNGLGKVVESFSDRLDSAAGAPGLKNTGPLLDPKGKPLRPFTLLGGNKRQEFGEGVFRPSHNLPTMSIDDYLEEERRRGGMIEGGGEQSGIKPQVDEDDYELADRETMKAREWDEYVEANPKGSGNTINRG